MEQSVKTIYPQNRTPSAKKKRRISSKVSPWLFLAPAIAIFSLYVIYPILDSIWLSFFEWDGLGEKEWVGLENYRELFDSEAFYTSLTNNFLWLIFFMLAPPCGLAIALFLNQQVRGIRVVKSLFFFPFVISQVVVGLVFAWFYDPSFGLFNIALGAFGIEPISILADEDYVTYGIIAAGLWPQISYCMILYLTGLNNLDPEQLEAARLDGAKKWQIGRAHV